MAGATSCADAGVGQESTISSASKALSEAAKEPRREALGRRANGIAGKIVYMRVIALCLALLVGPALGHEFWLEPVEYQIQPGGQLKAEIIIGDDFEGARMPYLPQRIVSYSVRAGENSARVAMRIGASPGLQQAPLGDGLHVVAYESVVAIVHYPNWDKFQAFFEQKDLGDVGKRQAARSLPKDSVSEAYTRFSKTMIAVGSGKGADRRTGMEAELVALQNPYTDKLAQGFRVQLFYKGTPRADTQIEVFRKAPAGTVVRTTVRTDKAGIAVVPVQPGHAYMLNAVVLREPSTALVDQTHVQWETLWANLTFAVPK